jgi:aminoglycoside phosphotransferase (APT) family kinase protein
MSDTDKIDELANPERLGRWMDQQGLDGEGAPRVAFISGGAQNEIFAVERGGRTMVLRRPPRVVPAGRNETMLREYRILAALNATDVPHPAAIAACDDESVLGAAFYLMEFVDGWSVMADPGNWPAPFDADLAARPGLAYELVDGAAKLANVDWRAVGLEGLGRPEGFHERQVDRWLSQWQRYKIRDLPGIDEAVEFLRGYEIRSYEPGVMHGDYQFANVMYRHGAPARLAAIVDFEMGTIGDPLIDLAWVLMSWPNADEDRSARSYVDYRGMPDREDLLEYYANHTGRPVDEIDYYLVLGNFKMAIVLEGGYARMVQGANDNPKAVHFGDYVLQSAAKAGALARSTPLARR